MQITNKFCAVTLIHCCVWVFFLCHTSLAAVSMDAAVEEAAIGKSAEIISGRPKIIYEIKSLSGEPDYKSVNLTWEIEPVVDQQQQQGEGGGELSKDDEQPLPIPAFQVYFCEMHSWGPQRCKSKVLNTQQSATNENHIEEDGISTGREFSLAIDNLRMATKYSFHVRQIAEGAALEPKGRRIEQSSMPENDLEKGEVIIIPTKGFTAHATKCLAQASEIEVETGPFFAGKILVENSDCVIEGNGESPQETYTMQIDHQRCGSQVFHNNLTVVTTVVTQENQGIFTHSTRRFLVVCSYQQEMLTVRASFSVPGKGGAEAETSPEWQRIAQPSRNARERQFKLVGRNALVLKDTDGERDQEKDRGLSLLEAEGSQYQYPAQVADVEDNSIVGGGDGEPTATNSRANYQRLIHDSDHDGHGQFNSHSKTSSSNSSPHRGNDRLTGIMIAASLSVIMIGSVAYLLLRESKKQRIAHNSQRVNRAVRP